MDLGTGECDAERGFRGSMTIRILDSLSTPTTAQIAAAKAVGISAYFGYVGGPEAAGLWPSSAFQTVVRGGLRTGAFWVGLGALETVGLKAREAGIPAGSVIGHDIETPASVDALSVALGAAFTDSCRQAGYRSALYGLSRLAGLYGHAYDAVWVAGGRAYRSGVPVPRSPAQGFGRIAPNMAWQWWGTHDFDGIGVDESIADDWFLGVENMATLGQKRATIFTFRVAAFGEWPPNQAAVDAYAAEIADDYGNVEEVLTRLLDDYRKNGGHPLWRSNIRG